ncbi:DUF4329 domain-containing protein [Altererythrobacter lutimaris]|uniref:DUF4329 domain-containing protein n=1 Tax=Altererythrobacter lutimaris TaxID=2743979 RepID=A0A850H768_9SPHN|nr:DUF4329 domain-containing protein [Altererythrobacter lutimaris]NVE93693.1 DUF4329 domain-containing protein [Altererythrobacter lutimaris]
MQNVRTTQIIYLLCAIAFVVIVARAISSVKGPEDFVVTATTEEVQAFAREQLAALQERSFAEDTEYCGIIFEDSNGDLGAGRILTGERASCDIAYFDEPGMAPLASFHTHGGFGEEFDSEVPSTIDLKSDIASRMDGYVSTPGGRFWRNDAEAGKSILVCGPGCLPRDPAYRPCPAAEPKPEYSVTSLRARFERGTERC